MSLHQSLVVWQQPRKVADQHGNLPAGGSQPRERAPPVSARWGLSSQCKARDTGTLPQVKESAYQSGPHTRGCLAPPSLPISILEASGQQLIFKSGQSYQLVTPNWAGATAPFSQGPLSPPFCPYCSQPVTRGTLTGPRPRPSLPTVSAALNLHPEVCPNFPS